MVTFTINIPYIAYMDPMGYNMCNIIHNYYWLFMHNFPQLEVNHRCQKDSAPRWTLLLTTWVTGELWCWQAVVTIYEAQQTSVILHSAPETESSNLVGTIVTIYLLIVTILIHYRHQLVAFGIMNDYEVSDFARKNRTLKGRAIHLCGPFHQRV